MIIPVYCGRVEFVIALNPASDGYGVRGVVYVDVILDRAREVLKDKTVLPLPKDFPNLVE